MSVIGVVTNPASASGRGARWGRQAIEGLRRASYEVIDLSRAQWHEAAQAAQAAASHLDALVVVGGDGMVHLGAQVCARRDLPLGIIAAGSGNDFANTLGLPVGNIDAAVAAVVRGLRQNSIRTVDVAEIRSPGAPRRYFAGVLSAGIDAAIAARGMRVSYPRGPAKYTVAIGLELPRFRPYGARVTVDGQRLDGPLTLVAIANASTIGGGIPISPQSSLTDGLLDVVTAESLTLAQIVRILPRLRRGEHLTHPAVRVRRGHTITLEPATGGAPLPPASADGEMVGHAPLTVVAVPGALHMVGAVHD